MTKNAGQGFTLIEILIVVAIIAILASVVLVGLGPTQQAGRDSRRLSDLREVQNGLELYYNKCGYYPGDVEAGTCGAFDTDYFWGVSAPTASGMTAALLQSGIGISAVPDDPTSGDTYYYGSNGTGSSYVIAAKLEQANNSVFNTYTAPDITGMTMGGAATGDYTAGCAATGIYCITL